MVSFEVGIRELSVGVQERKVRFYVIGSLRGRVKGLALLGILQYFPTHTTHAKGSLNSQYQNEVIADLIETM